MVTKKICLSIPSLQAGGMERVMTELAGYFATKEDVEVHLILYDLSREIFYQVPQGVLIHKPTFGFNNSWRMFYTIKTLIFLRKTIIKINPDSILSFGEYWNNFLLLSVIGLKFPVFVSDRGQPDKSLGWLQDLLRHWLYPKAKGLIFQTEKAKQIYLKKNKHKNIIVIGNPVKKIISDEPVIKREKIVLMVGRLIITKHQDKLIEMFADINLPDWKLMIVGYDHLKQNNLERLKKLAKDLKVEERVIFTGKVEDLKEIYLKSSLFAFTSSSEGFPNAIGEAMSAGIPAVAFDCVAGPSEMISDGYDGYLVPLFDYKQFKLRLSQLMIDEDLRQKIGKNGRESIKKFSTDKVCESFYRFITT
jgi:glycosyltransferase involved in cell wall biosynthesis